MRRYRLLIPLALIMLCGCKQAQPQRDYEEIPAMLNVLTNKAQAALEAGAFDKGEQAVRDHVRSTNPDFWEWFEKNDYEVKMGQAGDYAVVMVCDMGRPVFEDTYCNPGRPDKDHRNNQNARSCELTMTVEEVEGICK